MFQFFINLIPEFELPLLWKSVQEIMHMTALSHLNLCYFSQILYQCT